MLSQLMTLKRAVGKSAGSAAGGRGAPHGGETAGTGQRASGARSPAEGSMRAVPGCDGECEVDDERVRVRLV
jgi:hypothetical protein